MAVKKKTLQQLATERKMREAAKSKTTAAKAAEVAQLRDYYKKNGHIPTLLSNASKTRFGESDSQDVGELGRLVALGKITKAEAERRVKEGAAVNDPDALRAGLDVSASIDPQVNSITRKRSAAKAALESGLAQDESSTKRFTGDVQGLYAALQQQMAAMRPQVAANFDQSSAAIGANTSTLQQQIKDAYEKANATTAARVAGMGGGTTEAQTQGSQDQAFLSGLAGIQGATQQGLLGVAKTGALNVQDANQNYNAYEGTNVQANALRELLERSNSARQEFTAQDLEYGGEIEDLEGTRFAKLYEGKQSLAESRAAAQAEAEQTAFERALAQAKLGIDQGELDIKRGNLAINQQRVNLDSKKTMIQLQKEQRTLTPGTLEYLEKEAAINLKRAQAASTLTNAASSKQNAATNAAKLNKPGAVNYGKGIGGVQNFLKDIAADPASTALIMKHVSNTMKYFKDFQGGLKGIEGYIAKHKVPPAVADAMRRATGIAYGRSS